VSSLFSSNAMVWAMEAHRKADLQREDTYDLGGGRRPAPYIHGAVLSVGNEQALSS
jgi:hypothetical protein